MPARGRAAGRESRAAAAALEVRIHGATDERLDEAVEACAYFVAAESVTNAVRHAHASRVDIRLRRLTDAVRIEIEDDGRGGADPVAGTGLRGLADRVEALGGRFAVADGAGGGTIVSAELPA